MLLVFLYPIFLILYSLITVVDDPATDSQLADLQLQLITLEKVTRLAPIFFRGQSCNMFVCHIVCVKIRFPVFSLSHFLDMAEEEEE